MRITNIRNEYEYIRYSCRPLRMAGLRGGLLNLGLGGLLEHLLLNLISKQVIEFGSPSTELRT